MYIRTKLRIGTVATMVFVLLFIVLVPLFVSIVLRAYEQQKIAEEIVERSFQSSLLRNEYVQYPGERPKVQWISLYESRMRAFDIQAPLFSRALEKSIFDQLRASVESSRQLFEELVRNEEQGGGDTVIHELSNQMNIRAQTGISLALRLSEMSRKLTIDTARTFVLLVILGGFLVFAISVLSYIMSEKFSHAIRLLGEGMTIIASGDLTYQLQVPGNTEIGSMAEIFNAMTVRLTESRDMLEVRVRERTRDLEKANIFLDAIIENIPNMIFLKDAKELRFVRFNKAGEELLGYGRKDLLGKNDYDFFPKEQADFFIAKDSSVLAGRMLVDIPEEPIETKLNGKRWLHTKKIPLLNNAGQAEYLLGISEDITERREYDEGLRLANSKIRQEADNTKKFQLAVEAATDAIVITDASTNIVYVNPAWELLTGYSQAEVMGRRVSILKSVSTSPVVHAALRVAIAAGKPFHSDEIVNVKKDGTTYDVDLTIYPVRSGDALQYFVGVHTDITIRKRSDIAKTEFVSLASHQLRTPLTEIRWALSNIARECPLDTEHANALGAARTATETMAETIRSMLLISRVDAGNLDLAASLFPLKEVIEKAIALLEGMRARHDIQVAVDCPDDCTVWTDAQLLHEILTNLLSNAYKYTPPGGTVTMRVRREGSSVRIDVQDTGMGIPVSEQERVGQKFFRASNAVIKKEPGTGLGLYLVYSLVAFLGARITFVSGEHAGTTFTIHLPSTSSSHA